jgi:hypothetical protein
MTGLRNKLLRMCSVGTMFLLMLAALGATAKPALGQDTVQGKFILTGEARLGKTMLPAGEYKFYVTPLGNTFSVESIQTVNSPVLVVIWGAAKNGPMASVLATASRPTDMSNPQTMDLQADGTGTVIYSMSLEKLGLVVQFREPKIENEMRARGAEPPQARAVAKGGD